MPNAGPYAARQPLQEKGEDPVTVLVTGFGVRRTIFYTSLSHSSIHKTPPVSVSHPLSVTCSTSLGRIR